MLVEEYEYHEEIADYLLLLAVFVHAGSWGGWRLQVRSVG
jgi:hypothetical protein